MFKRTEVFLAKFKFPKTLKKFSKMKIFINSQKINFSVSLTSAAIN